LFVYSGVTLILLYFGLVWQPFDGVFVCILGSDSKLMRPFPLSSMCPISRVLWAINNSFTAEFHLPALVGLLQYFREYGARDEAITRS
jgi:hypothetical protein